MIVTVVLICHNVNKMITQNWGSVYYTPQRESLSQICINTQYIDLIQILKEDVSKNIKQVVPRYSENMRGPKVCVYIINYRTKILRFTTVISA